MGCRVRLPDEVRDYVYNALRPNLRNQFKALFARLELDDPPAPGYTSPPAEAFTISAPSIWVQFSFREGNLIVSRVGVSSRVVLVHPWMRNSELYGAHIIEGGT